MFTDNRPVILPDAFLRNRSPYAGSGINVGIPADDRAWVQHAVATDFDAVTEHRTDFFSSGLYFFITAFDSHRKLVTFDIGRD